MKLHPRFSLVASIWSCTLCVVTLASIGARASVYVAGLGQAQFDYSDTNDAYGKRDDIASAANLTFTAGTIMADTTGSAKDHAGTSWSWAANRQFGYLGEMHMEAGTTYTFGKSVDDSTYLVVDGQTLINDTTWNSFKHGSYTATGTGWVPIEVRFANGGGGAGLSQSAKYGFAYNTTGLTDWDSFKAANGWTDFRDPGDASLLRYVFSSSDIMMVDSIAQNGANLDVTLSFVNVPAGGATAIIYYGAGDGGNEESAWASHATVVTVPAGNTASTTYTISGAGSAAFAAVKMVGIDTPFFQWSESANLNSAAPTFGIANTAYAYTNATYHAAIQGLGSGASSVTASVQLSLVSDFATIAFSKPLSITTTGAENVTFTGLATNTTYYARVFGTNDQNEPGASGNVVITTLAPGVPDATIAPVSVAFTSAIFSISTSSLGVGAESGTLILDVATDAAFTSPLVFGSIPITADATETVTASGLANGARYYARTRVVNDWGLVGVSSTIPFETRAEPVVMSALAAVAGAEGFETIAISSLVVEPGASFTVAFAVDGETIRTMPGTGVASFSANYAGAPGSAHTATATVVSTYNGVDYTKVYTTSFTVGASFYVPAAFADISSYFLKVGEKVSLPAPATADEYYLPLDARILSLDEDGVTLTALEPGFCTVLSYAYNPVAGAVTLADSAQVVVVPTALDAGRVFVSTPIDSDWNWNDAGKWVCVTDPSLTGSTYPDGVDDVAMVRMGARTLTVNVNPTIGELYMGPIPSVIMSSGEKSMRIRGASGGSTVTFAHASAKNAGLFKITGLGRYDIFACKLQCYIGGNDSSHPLSIAPSGNMVFDGGSMLDETDAAIRGNYNVVRPMFERGSWTISEGTTLRIQNVSGSRLWGDDQGGYANVKLQESFHFLGSGIFDYTADSAVAVENNGPFVEFEGNVLVRNNNIRNDFRMGSRGGSFWFGYESQNTPVNATLTIEGYAGANDINAGFKVEQSVGVVGFGNSHGYGGWGASANAYPNKAIVMNGGMIRQSAMYNDWAKDSGVYTIPNGADKLVVSNGLSSIQLFNSQNNANDPTNSIAFSSLEHAGHGVLDLQTDRMCSSDAEKGTSAHHDLIRIGGFHNLAVGGTGTAFVERGTARFGYETNHLDATAPIIPWIVTHIRNQNQLFFPGATPDGEIVMGGYPTAKVLDTVTDPTENVYVKSTSLALTSDKTVNSLVVQGTYNKTHTLGADRTLTITSGGLILGAWDLVKIDNDAACANGTRGTIVFGDTAYVYSTRSSLTSGGAGPNGIWSRIVAPNGLVATYPGYLLIAGDQTGIDDGLWVVGSKFYLGTESTPAVLDVPVYIVGGGSSLTIQNAGSFSNQILYFEDLAEVPGKFIPAAGTTERVLKCYVNGVSVPRGLYGSSDSEAEIVDDEHFSGTGMVQIVRDDLIQPTIIYFY